MPRRIPLYTLDGVRDARIGTHPFATEDGLGLSMLRFLRQPSDDVVLVVHGLTTSSDMFIMPEHENLVTFLLDNGFSDVWTLDFRMSNRHHYNRARHRYTLDDVALYDFPAALRELRSVVGEDRRVHVIAHCLGSVSFLMSLFGGAVDGISSVIANSVGLTPRVPAWSRLKLSVAPALMEYVLGFPYLDPRWHTEPKLTRGWLFSRAVSLFHRECDNPACHMLSLMWGTGWPALYSHENLHDVTHERGGDLYGATGFHYYRHVAAMVRAGRAVKYDPGEQRHRALPDDYLANAAEVTTPVLLTTGEKNRVFADSNIVCYEQLEAVAPGRHELEVFPGYGHQDVFMGSQVATDVFPRMLDFLKRQAA
ncbi:alpha/beta hydrolase [Prauserella muralis]|uniref:Alpha/beta hydrolase n=1 Tax=Prauserella muralis TaxID=588067 RepID=A0A2V4BBQ0_9PSEU|nr:alpha/beta fold hydrolase [Prauserella muralis]PXY32586.1 alpha/beta hydrolase [Prauserella muralis]TWE23697.1 alpha/beta hydrolase family protein [Prauserella muralis]